MRHGANVLGPGGSAPGRPQTGEEFHKCLQATASVVHECQY